MKILKKILLVPVLLFLNNPFEGNQCFASSIQGPIIAAKSWILLDFDSGQVLASHDADQKIEPASLTKLMTAHLAFLAIEHGQMDLNYRPPVSIRAYKSPGSRMFLETRQPASVEELLNGMIVQSGNDASVVLAEALQGSEENFAEEMNKEAEQLGMKHSRFQNATGLPDPNHYSTAEDLATLATYLIKNHPTFYPLYSKQEYTYNSIRQLNRNRLLAVDPSVDGVKTGYTEAAGYSLIASARRERNGITRRLISVVIGAKSSISRAIESQKLLNYGFQSFEAIQLYKKGEEVNRYEIWKGLKKQVAGIFQEDILVTVPRGKSAGLKAEIERIQPLIAPITEGQEIGTLRVYFDKKLISQHQLHAYESISSAGWLGRAWDSLIMLFSSKSNKPNQALEQSS